MDAKSLLRAKKAESRITHPYAAYNNAGILRCSICAVPVKQWDAHLMTKQHRQSVAREKAEQEKALKAKTKSKRPLSQSADIDGQGQGQGQPGESSKRAKTQPTHNEEDDDEDESGRRVGGLPAGFFSSSNQPKPLSRSPSPEPQQSLQPTGDTELDDFLSSLNDDTPSSTAPITAQSQTKQINGKRKTYKEIIPSQTSYEAGPVRIAPPTKDDQKDAVQEEEEPEESEQERKDRLEREEREEIVRRLEEEERAQEDADSRVASLKARMEMLKKRREAKGNKPKSANTNGA
ncbi:hypothetical protein L486_01778 [Kwoniella mangroviensis CBS 10435]|uniref:Zinc finger protein 830 n=1 Tax=Kwoniella mangroviensis CBS 10435 TaxID=1331196 RepID=A0A1B9J2V0_9TREE|nr:hypothetical protein L486_01778 [Kwoniella mangroviensis CBS 10435]OCF73317.1 hypothetical protein I204_06548 [Kwoniella mangroviensis CBS 8886]